MCTFGILGLSCETPAASGPGLHTTSRELQTCTFEGLGQKWIGQKFDWAKIRLAKNSIGQNWIGQNWIWPKLAGPKRRWPKMDWPKPVKSGRPKRDWPKSVPCGVASTHNKQTAKDTKPNLTHSAGARGDSNRRRLLKRLQEPVETSVVAHGVCVEDPCLSEVASETNSVLIRTLDVNRQTITTTLPYLTKS